MPKTSLRNLPFEVWALVIGMFTVALGYGVIAPVLPAFAKEFGVSFAAASAIVSIFAFMRLVFAPASGALVRRLGERKVYISGLLIVALSTGACAFAMDYLQLVILRGLGGIGSIMFSVSAMGLLIKLSPVDARARVASLNSGSFMVGALAGPIIGALVAGFGLRAPFVVYFFTLLVAAAIVGFALRGSTFLNEDMQQESHPTMALRFALKLPQYRGALASGFAHGWASFGVRASIVPLFVVAALGQSASAAGWMLAAFSIANLAVIIPSGRLADRVGRKPLIVVGLALTALGMALLPASTGFGDAAFPLALVFSAIAGVGAAFTIPAQQAVIADVVGNKLRGGQVIATFQMATDLGGMIGPVLAGLIVDALGFGWAFSVTAAILVAAVMVWAVTPDSRKLQVSTTTDTIPTQPEAA